MRLPNRYLYRWPLIGLLFLSCAGSTKLTKDLDPISHLRREIEHILADSSLSQSRTGIKIISLASDEVLYQRDSNLLFHPASNMKLLTTATALSRLGPSYRIVTRVATDTGAVTNEGLDGNLYLAGGGDPDLTVNDLRGLVQELKALGIKRISGDLICVRSFLDDYDFGSGWMWDDASSFYFPPISALTVEQNCVTIKVRPGKNVNDSLYVELIPATSYVQIENRGMTADSSDSTLIEQFNVERKWRENENTIIVEGGLIPDAEIEEFVIEIEEPALYFGTLFSEILRDEQVAFEGQILQGVLPDTFSILLEHLSEPLATIISRTNKPSSNIHAELLLKIIGAEIKGVPGSAEKGLSVMKEFLHDMGLDSTTYEVADGSGVSRYNIISPDLIIGLLQAMHEDFRIQAEFKASLPIAGRDGTLDYRMINSPAEGKLRAKTGSLRGVSALSGYTTTAEDEPIAFSMMMEHFVVPASRIRKVQDRIGVLLSSFSRQ